MSKKAYLLVAGAWHGSWCWEQVVLRLERAGHTAVAPDLPGCTAQDPAAASVTLSAWTQCIGALLEEMREPAILVGHSRAGIVISQVAEQMPERVRELVYVAGLLVRNGESALGMLREDGTSPLLSNVSLSADRSCWTLAEGTPCSLFFGACRPEEAQRAVARLGVEPAKPLMTPLRLSEAGFGSVRRSYVECLRDGAVPLSLQRKMQARVPCAGTSALDTDHAPFLSAPDALAERLLSI